MSGFEHTWVFAVGLLGFLALWPISLIRRDSSIVDFWWGPGIGAMAVAMWVAMGMPLNGATLIVLFPLVAWSLRLGIHLGIRRVNEGSEDPRYTELRRRYSPGWGWKSLFIVFVLQGVLQVIVGLGGLAALAVAPAQAPSAAVMLLSVIAVLAICVQTVSDIQLDRYRAKVPHGGLLTTGLRSIVRYPSYSAEIVFWLAIAGIAVLYGVWWAPLPAAIVIALLRYVSGVPILEDRLNRTRASFAAYQSQVPALVPRFRDTDMSRQKAAD